jgi:hypothetical protein
VATTIRIGRGAGGIRSRMVFAALSTFQSFAEGGNVMSTQMIAFMSFGAGAGLMYLADPQAGRGRRALLGDAIVHASHRANAAAARVSQDVENRWTGLVARTHA